MSTAAAPAATATASKTTVEAAETTARVIPARDEVLKHFAREAQGLPPDETAAPTAEADPENADENALSQTAAETAGAQTETETAEATTEAEDAVENHLDAELSAEIPPEVQEKINRRIGKEVAKTKAEREARETAEAKLAEAEAKLADTPAAPVKLPALGHIHDAGKLAVEKAKAEEALEQAEDLLDTLEGDPASVEKILRSAKVELKDEAGEEDYSEARMKKFLRDVQKKADRTLRRDIPAREKFLGEANNYAKNAVELMPELKDAKSERAKLFQQVLRELPEIQRNANWPLMAVAGVKAMEWMKETLEAKTKAAAPPKPKRELPTTIPAPRTAAPATTQAKGKTAETVDASAVADKLLTGDKSQRLNILKSFVPKSS